MLVEKGLSLEDSQELATGDWSRVRPVLQRIYLDFNFSGDDNFTFEQIFANISVMEADGLRFFRGPRGGRKEAILAFLANKNISTERKIDLFSECGADGPPKGQAEVIMAMHDLLETDKNSALAMECYNVLVGLWKSKRASKINFNMFMPDVGPDINSVSWRSRSQGTLGEQAALTLLATQIIPSAMRKEAILGKYGQVGVYRMAMRTDLSTEEISQILAGSWAGKTDELAMQIVIKLASTYDLTEEDQARAEEIMDGLRSWHMIGGGSAARDLISLFSDKIQTWPRKIQAKMGEFMMHGVDPEDFPDGIEKINDETYYAGQLIYGLKDAEQLALSPGIESSLKDLMMHPQKDVRLIGMSVMKEWREHKKEITTIGDRHV